MPKRRSIKTSSPSDFEPKRKNPISLGSDSNLDNDFKPLKIGGESTGLEFSKGKIKSSADEFITQKEQTQELSVTTIKGNQIPSATEPQIIFQNKAPSGEKAGLWFNIYSTGTTMLKASDSSGSNKAILLFAEDFTIDADEGLHLSNSTGVLMDAGGTAVDGTTEDVRIYNTSDYNDYFKILVEANGVTTLSTIDGDSSGSTDAGHMKFEPEGSFLIKELASAGGDVAGYGQLWVKNDAPNNLYFVNDAGNEVQITNGSSLAGGGASALNDLSDVTYSSGDLTISSLDKIITSGDLDFVVAGGDLTFRAHEYGSSYDGGVEFNITGNTIKFQRNIDTGLSGFTFDLGLSYSTIDTGLDGMYLYCGDNFNVQTSSTTKRLKFMRQDSTYADVRLETSNQWSALTQFEDWINSTSGAGGTDTYGLLKGFLVIEDDTGFDNTFLMRLESATMKSTTFTNYGSSVAGTVKGTASNHGFETGDNVRKEDTTDYNGTHVITKIDDNNFYFTDTYTSDQSGKSHLSVDKILENRKYGHFAIDKDGDIHSSGSLNIHDTTDIGDYFKIEATTHGATTISTVDDDATAGHLTIQPDGDLLLQPASENIKIPGDTKLFFGTNSANDYIFADPDASELYVAMNDSDVMTFMDDRVDVGVQLETNEIMLTEAASAVADRAGKGQLWVKNDTPNNLYFTNDAGNDVQITNGSSLAGGGGASKYAIGFMGRGRCQYNNWYNGSHYYGPAYYFWNQSSGSSTLPTAWVDDRHPQHLVPYAGTITGYTIIGNIGSTDTMEWALLKGTGVTFGSAGDWTLSQVGATQSAGGTAHIQYKWEQTGLSVSVAKNDILMFFFRRTTDNDSSYVYNEFSYNILIEAS